MARKNRKVLLFVLLLVLGTGMASYFLRGQILTSVAEYLIVSDPLQKADAIEVLSGGEPRRSRKAAELYHQGWAPRVLITKEERTFVLEELRGYGISAFEEHDVAFAVLKFFRVPADSVEILEGVNHSTLEEAQRLRGYMQQRGLKRLIVVTSNFHTRRTRLLFRRVFKGTGIDILVAAAPPDSWFNPEKWWTRRMDCRTLLWEYQKLIFYAVRYW